jgi:hypothetical protein
MGESDRMPAPVSHEDNRTITALAEQRQTLGGGHQPIREPGAATLLAHDDVAPMYLLEKSDILQAQDPCDLAPRRRRIMADLLYVRPLPCGHEMRDAEGLQSSKAAHLPPVRQPLQSERPL